MKRSVCTLLICLGVPLAAADWEVSVSTALQSPARGLSHETVDAMGQRMGRSFTAGSDFRPFGLGGSYTALAYGPWRLRAGLEASMGGPSPDLSIRSVRTTGIQSRFAEASGSMKCRSVAPALTLSFVSSSLGEYGLTLEDRFQRLTYDAASLTVESPEGSGQRGPLSRSISRQVPWVDVHATFTQQYPSVAFIARFSLGLALKGAPDIEAFSDAQFANLDEGILETVLPRREVKVAMGVRF